MMERPSKPENVPYIVFEGEMTRQERHVRRLWISLLAAITAIVLTVGIFVWYLNQYDFESYQQDGEGVNIIGNMNGVDYDGAERQETYEEERISEG